MYQNVRTIHYKNPQQISNCGDLPQLNKENLQNL